MLLCLHVGARNALHAFKFVIMWTVMCTVLSKVNDITTYCIWPLSIRIILIYFLCFHLINVLQSNSVVQIPSTMHKHMTNMM